ncbi:MAG: hypothetical protein ACHQU0_00680 [Candidatus Paceibacteria bacterium]
MKTTIAKVVASFFVAVLFAISLVGCSGSNGKLTNNQAHDAVWEFVSTNRGADEVTIIGIREIPQDNTARVDFQAKNWVIYGDPSDFRGAVMIQRETNWAKPGWGIFQWSGQATGIFEKHTDNTWKLTGIEMGSGFSRHHWDNLQIAVK